MNKKDCEFTFLDASAGEGYLTPYHPEMQNYNKYDRVP